MNPATESSSVRHSPAVRLRILDMGIRSTKPLLNIIPSGLAIWSSVGIVPQPIVAGWSAAVALCVLVGTALRSHLRRIDLNKASPQLLRQIFRRTLVYILIISALWGSSSLLLVRGQNEHNLVVTMIYIGVCFGAASVSIFGLTHLILGSVVAFLLYVAAFPHIFPTLWVPLTAMFALYHLVIVRTAFSRNAMHIENLYLQAEKDELVEKHRSAANEAEQANLDKSVFLAAASHDLRQPVHALMLSGHALKMRLANTEYSPLVERILEAGTILSEQFNNLMDLSRLESGAYPMSTVITPLRPLMERIVDTKASVAASRGIALKLRFGLGTDGCCIRTDVALLTRSIDNLIDNAIKFSAPGTRILVAVRRQQNALCFSVHDRGMGIPAELLPTIFKPYVQLNNPTRDRSRGIGLGLSIVSEAISRMGGEIYVQSEYGKGSCFYFRLPLEPGLQAPPPVELGPIITPDVRRLAGSRLMIVDDDPLAAGALATWASGWGMAIETCADPRQLDMSAPAPDIILCDIRLPGERDGVSWLSDWLGHWPSARGMLISGEVLPATIQRAEQEGLILLSKPVDPEILLQTISSLLHPGSPA